MIATHTPEEDNDYMGNMFVVAVFEENTTVEVYNSNASKTKDILKMILTVLMGSFPL